MAQVNITGILDYYSDDFARALEKAVTRTLPGATVDRSRLFAAFVNAVDGEFAEWEQLPDQYMTGG